MRLRLLVAALATAAFMALGAGSASAQSVGTIEARINWDNGGYMAGSSVRQTWRYFDAWVNRSCGGRMWVSLRNKGEWPGYPGALSGDFNNATFYMSSRGDQNNTLPYDSCDGFYHDYNVNGTVTGIGTPRVYQSNPLILERDATGSAVFCMVPWFGSGGGCTAVFGSGWLRWKPA